MGSLSCLKLTLTSTYTNGALRTAAGNDPKTVQAFMWYKSLLEAHKVMFEKSC